MIWHQIVKSGCTIFVHSALLKFEKSSDISCLKSLFRCTDQKNFGLIKSLFFFNIWCMNTNLIIDCWSWVRKFKWDIFCWCSNTVPNLFVFFQNGGYSFYFLLWLIATLPKKKKRIKYFQRKQESLLTQTLLTVKGNQTVLNA